MQSETLYEGFGWRVNLEEAPLPDGRTKKAVRVHRCDSVHIIAFTQARNILLLREFRPFYGDYIWMLPSGRADKETDLAAAAQRELREETGFRADNMEHYTTTRHSESIDAANHIFLAHGLTKDPLSQDPDEMIEVHEVPLTEALDKVLSSIVIHTASAYGLLRYAREFSKL